MAPELCPRFHKAIELIGSRWTGPILQILLSGPARFAEIGAAIPHISDRMLSERLQALEVEGLVVRSVFPDPPIRVEYALTEKGRELQTSLEAVGKWAERWIVLPSQPAARVKGARAAHAATSRRPASAPGRRSRPL